MRERSGELREAGESVVGDERGDNGEKDGRGRRDSKDKKM